MAYSTDNVFIAVTFFVLTLISFLLYVAVKRVTKVIEGAAPAPRTPAQTILLLIFSLFAISMSVLSLAGIYRDLPRTDPSKDRTKDVNINPDFDETTKSSPVNYIAKELNALIENEDELFSGAATENTDDWPLFVHPDGIYTIRHHPNIVPLITKPVEGGYARVVFVPKSSPLINTDISSLNGNIPGFRGELYFWGGGGGGRCTVGCISVGYYLPDLEPFRVPNAIEPHFEEKTEGEMDNNEAKLIIMSMYNFFPFVNTRYEFMIYSRYTAGNQREVLRKMYSTLTWYPDKMVNLRYNP